MKEFGNTAHKPPVAVVDGDSTHRDALAGALAAFYDVVGYGDSIQALEDMASQPPDVVILDEWVPPDGGLKLLQTFRGIDTLAAIPVICTSAETGVEFFPSARGMGVSITLNKPIKFSQLLSSISAQVNRAAEKEWDKIEPVQQSALKKTITIFNTIPDLIDAGKPLPYGEVKDSCEPLVAAVTSNQYKDLLRNVRGHDNYSYVHSLRVATFLSLFGNTIGIEGGDLMVLSTGGLVHDIGKMSIPCGVLNKPGKLEGSEWDVMKSHVNVTIHCLEDSPDIPKGVITIASQHHEKLDGSGYPKGLSGTDLNDLARMATIVDIFGALTDRRCYKDPVPPEKALAIMLDMKDALDRELLMLFREMLLDAATDAD